MSKKYEEICRKGNFPESLLTTIDVSSKFKCPELTSSFLVLYFLSPEYDEAVFPLDKDRHAHTLPVFEAVKKYFELNPGRTLLPVTRTIVFNGNVLYKNVDIIVRIEWDNPFPEAHRVLFKTEKEVVKFDVPKGAKHLDLCFFVLLYPDGVIVEGLKGGKVWGIQMMSDDRSKLV